MDLCPALLGRLRLRKRSAEQRGRQLKCRRGLLVKRPCRAREDGDPRDGGVLVENRDGQQASDAEPVAGVGQHLGRLAAAIVADALQSSIRPGASFWNEDRPELDVERPVAVVCACPFPHAVA